jgi:hypothetical protein
MEKFCGWKISQVLPRLPSTWKVVAILRSKQKSSNLVTTLCRANPVLKVLEAANGKGFGQIGGRKRAGTSDGNRGQILKHRRANRCRLLLRLRFPALQPCFVIAQVSNASSSDRAAVWEAGGRRQETGNRRQETGNRRQETGNRRQEAGGRRQETGDRRQETGNRKQETGNRRQETGDRKQETGNKGEA